MKVQKMDFNLTPREKEVLDFVVKGYSNVQIAKILKVTDFTVRAHVQAILRKLRVKNRIQAAVLAIISADV